MGDEKNKGDKNSSTDAPLEQSHCLPPQHNEVPSAQPYPQAYLQSCEPYTNEPPPSYDALYTATPPDPQAIQFVHIVQHQPQHTVIARPPDRKPQSFFTFTLICFILTAIYAWPWLVCTIPALIFSNMSKKSSNKGDRVNGKIYGKWACGCNIVALITYVSWIILLVVLIVT